MAFVSFIARFLLRVLIYALRLIFWSLLLITVVIVFSIPLPVHRFLSAYMPEGVDISMEKATLGFTFHYPFFYLNFHHIHIQTAYVDFTLNSFGVSADLPSLLHGEFKLISLILDGLSLQVVRSPTDQFSFSLLDAPTVQEATTTALWQPDDPSHVLLRALSQSNEVTPLPLTYSVERGLEIPESSFLSALNSILLKNITLVLDDRKHHITWHGSIPSAFLHKDYDHYQILLDLLLVKDLVSSSVRLSLDYVPMSHRLKGTVHLDSFPLSHLSYAFPYNFAFSAYIPNMTSTLNANSIFDVNINTFDIHALDFSLQVGEGQIDLPEFLATPIALESFTMTGSWQDTYQRIIVPQMSLALAGDGILALTPLGTSWFLQRATANALIYPKEQRLHLRNIAGFVTPQTPAIADIQIFADKGSYILDLKAEAKTLNRNLAMTLWPPIWGPEAYNWAVNGIQRGSLDKVTTSLRLRLDPDFEIWLDKLSGTMEASDAVVLYIPTMPSAYVSKASMTYDLDTFDVRFFHGTTMDTIEASSGRVLIALDPKTDDATLSLWLKDVSAPVPSLLTFLSFPPIGLSTSTAISPNDFLGKATIPTSMLKFNLSKGILLDMHHTARLQDISIPSMNLQHGAFLLTVLKDTLTMKGIVSYKGLALDVHWDQIFSKQARTLLQLKTSMTVDALRQFAIVPDFLLFPLSGKMNIHLQYEDTYTGAPANIFLRAHMNDTVLALPSLGYHKSAGVSMQFSGHLSFRDGQLLSLNRATFVAPNLSAAFSIAFPENQHVITLDKLTLLRHTDIAGSFIFAPDSTSITLTGTRFNLHGFKTLAEDAFADSEKSPTPHSAPLSETDHGLHLTSSHFAVPTLFHSDDTGAPILRNLKVSYAITGETLMDKGTIARNVRLSFSTNSRSTFNTFSAEGTISNSRFFGALDSQNRVVLTLANVGAFFKGFYITDLFSGGQGTLIIHPFSLQHASFSMQGDFSSIGLFNFEFQKIFMSLQMSTGILTITKFVMDGLLYNGHLSGYVDFNKDYVRIDGALAFIRQGLLATSISVAGKPSNPRVRIEDIALLERSRNKGILQDEFSGGENILEELGDYVPSIGDVVKTIVNPLRLFQSSPDNTKPTKTPAKKSKSPRDEQRENNSPNAPDGEP